MLRTDFSYDLPEDLIAQEEVGPAADDAVAVIALRSLPRAFAVPVPRRMPDE